MQNVPFSQILDYKEAFHKHYRKQAELIRETPIAPQSYYSVLPSGNLVADQDLDMHLCEELFEEEFEHTVVDQSSYSNTFLASPITIAMSMASPFKKKPYRMNTQTSNKKDAALGGNCLESSAYISINRLRYQEESCKTFIKGQDSSGPLMNSAISLESPFIWSKNPKNIGKPFINLLPIDRIEELDQEEGMAGSVENRYRNKSLYESERATGFMTMPNKKQNNYFQGFGVFKNSTKDLDENEFDVLSKIDKIQQNNLTANMQKERESNNRNTSERESQTSQNPSPGLKSVSNSSQATVELSNLPRAPQGSKVKNNTLIKDEIISNETTTRKQRVLETLKVPSPNPSHNHQTVQNMISKPEPNSGKIIKNADISPNKSERKAPVSISTRVPETLPWASKKTRDENFLSSPSAGFDYTPKDAITTKSRGGQSDFSQGITPNNKSEVYLKKSYITMPSLKNQLASSLAKESPSTHRSMRLPASQINYHQNDNNSKVDHSNEPRVDSKRKTSEDLNPSRMTKKKPLSKMSKKSKAETKGLFSDNIKRVIMKPSQKKISGHSKIRTFNTRTWDSKKSSADKISTDAKHSDYKRQTGQVQRNSQTSNISDIMVSSNIAPILAIDSYNLSATESNKKEKQMNKMLEDVQNKISKVEQMVSKLTPFPNPISKKAKVEFIGLARSSIQVSKSCQKSLTKMNISPSRVSVVSGKKSPSLAPISIANKKPSAESGNSKNMFKSRQNRLRSLEEKGRTGSGGNSPSNWRTPNIAENAPPSRLDRNHEKKPSKDLSFISTPSVMVRSQAGASPRMTDILNNLKEGVSIYDCKPEVKNITVSFVALITNIECGTRKSLERSTLLKNSINPPSKKSGAQTFSNIGAVIRGLKLKSKTAIKTDSSSFVAIAGKSDLAEDKSHISVLSRIDQFKQKSIKNGRSPTIVKPTGADINRSVIRTTLSSKLLSKRLNL